MDKDARLAIQLRGCEWRGIANKIHDMVTCEQQDINEWLIHTAHTAETRSVECYAIYKVLTTGDPK